MKFRVLGCASGLPHPKLSHSCYLLETTNARILFDIGEGASSAMARLKIDPRKIDCIFVSHMHPDHIMGLPIFIQWNCILKRKERLDVFLPSEAIKGVRSLLDLTYRFDYKLGFELELHALDLKFVFEMQDLKIKPHPNNHLQNHKNFLKSAGFPNKMESYSFLIESGADKAVYSADLDELDDLVPVVENTTLLIIDSMHPDLGKLAKFVKRNKIKKILLTHLSQEINLSPLLARLRAENLRGILKAREGLVIRV
jgi:ribonuclease BN (tRNA processing enzyme)